MLGKPTVDTVPPSFTPRLATMGNGANLPSASAQLQRDKHAGSYNLRFQRSRLFAYFVSFAVRSESARGLARSTTLRAVRMSPANASRLGLSTLRSTATEDGRWPSTALPLTMSPRWSFV
jgi:hypothetical protein